MRKLKQRCTLRVMYTWNRTQRNVIQQGLKNVGLSTINLMLLSKFPVKWQVNNVRKVLRPLCCGPGNIHGFPWMKHPAVKDRLLLKHQLFLWFLCEDKNLNSMCVQPHYCRVWQVEPCHRLTEAARRNSPRTADFEACIASSNLRVATKLCAHNT